jgi:hypothetical protein
LKDNLKEHLQGVKNSCIAVKDIVYALAASNKTKNNSRIVQVLGVDWRNLKRTIENRFSLYCGWNAFWLNNKKIGKHANVMNKVAIQLIVSFWTLETTISPNAKDVTWKRIGVKEYDVCATHYLQVSQLNVNLPNYELFSVSEWSNLWFFYLILTRVKDCQKTLMCCLKLK